MADSTLIDDSGNLFGVVNVIDALVILFVVAIFIGGLSLVFGAQSNATTASDSNNTTEEVHISLDLGTESTLIASEVQEGDTYAPNEKSTLTITDVLRSPTSGGTKILVRARLDGPEHENHSDVVSYDGEPPRLGRYVSIATETYDVGGEIIQVGERPTLDTKPETALVQFTSAIDDDTKLTESAEFLEAGEVLGSVKSIEATEFSDEERIQTYAKLELITYQRNGKRFFGSSEFAAGSQISIPVEGDDISGTVLAVGQLPDITEEQREVLVTDVVSGRTARRIEPGDSYQIGEREVGTVEQVTVYGTNNFDRKRIYLGLTMETIRNDGESYFNGRTLDEDSTIAFTTDDYDVSGSVVRLDTTEKQGSVTNETVKLRLSNVQPFRAKWIDEGTVYRENGKQMARIESIERKNATRTLRTNDGELVATEHPENQDIEITATLRLRKGDSGYEFNDNPIRPGGEITLFLNGIRITPRVTSL